MTINYKIDEKDFLIYQLYIASKSHRIKRKRQRSKIMIPLLYLGLGLLLLFQNKTLLAIIFFIVGFLWFIIYPLWEKQRYIKHYQSFIKENYQDRLSKTITLELHNDFILTKGNGNESKVLTTEIEEICEIPTIILLRLKGGHSFILPKEQMSNLDSVRTRLRELAIHLNINYETDEKWKWK